MGKVLIGLLIGLASSPACKKQERPDEVVVAASQSSRDNATRASMLTIARVQSSFHAAHGRYGSLAELVDGGFLPNDPSEARMSQFFIEASENAFGCYSTPTDYPASGRMSYFIDQTGKLRGSDRRGGRASATDPGFSFSPRSER
ncbi:MAG: hypothetical protein SNJ62_04530 [Chloracidobacterium sp.]